MKKLLCILLLVVSFSFHSKAQWVTIPDANFVAYLQQYFPTCMNGNQMDTTCAGITDTTSINVSGYNIYDLTGIQYFDNLDTLSCFQNHLTLFPNLPATLRYLICDNNQLTNLPSLPLNLKKLTCHHNLITYLPTLPASLTYLSCSYNQLTNIPVLPNSLTYLFCNNNAISCFPVFPVSLLNSSWFNISSNSYACLPNYVPAMNGSYLSYPLCLTGDLSNNPNNCNGASGIIGYCYKDINSNCIFDSGDLPQPNIKVKLFDNNNNFISQTYSALNGIYDFAVSSGTYSVNIDTSNVPYTVHCASPGIDSTVVLNSANPLITNLNVDITCKPSFDIGTYSVIPSGRVMPGGTHGLRILAGEISNWFNLHCTSGLSGQVVVSVSGPVIFSGVVPGALTPSILGNVFTYSIPDFDIVNTITDFGLIFNIPSTANYWDTICVNIIVTPTSGDNNILNNNYNFCYLINDGYDPNYKETYPINVQTGFNDYFYYTVHFQNTGNAPAINIHLQDTLDANLDLNTFQVINYSHYNTTWLTGNKLSFNFPNIQLPDSTSNFDGSQGFVQYRIKPLANLPAGTLIHNKASIYFDYNTPVVTNTITNTFMGTAGINQSHISHLISQVFIYPNPSNGKFSISFSEEQKHTIIKVTNLLGECIEQLTTNNKQVILDLSSFANGIYFVKIEDENQNINYRKIVKE